jgi:hypothetical protein
MERAVCPQLAGGRDRGRERRCCAGGARVFPHGEVPVGCGACISRTQRTRRNHFARMQAVAQRVLREVPGSTGWPRTRRPRDRHRDRPQRVHPPAAADIAQRGGRSCASEGMTATVSSIHINGWFGGHNKLVGARWIVQRVVDPRSRRRARRWVYVGDSTNDQRMFEACSATASVWPTSAVSAGADPPAAFREPFAERGAGFCGDGRHALLAPRASHPDTAWGLARWSRDPAPMAMPASACSAIFGSTFLSWWGISCCCRCCCCGSRVPMCPAAWPACSRRLRLGRHLPVHTVQLVGGSGSGGVQTLWLAGSHPGPGVAGFALHRRRSQPGSHCNC